MTTFEKAKMFIHRNARPLDMARWRFHFENGSKEDVLDVLRYYQNDDGGFGHAIEADLWNPASTPISTWAATEIINEIGLTDKNNSIVQGILRYLLSKDSFDTDKMQWLNTVPSNNDHPHAIWWTFDKCSEYKYNPTAALAAFIIRFADRRELYDMGINIAKQAVDWFLSSDICEQHIAACFIVLYKALEETGADTGIDLIRFRDCLTKNVSECICKETDRWQTEYVCKPSNFHITKDSIFYPGNEEICRAEADHIRDTQLEDGSFIVPWQWYNDYKEYETAANFWKSSIIIERMLFLRSFE